MRSKFNDDSIANAKQTIQSAAKNDPTPKMCLPSHARIILLGLHQILSASCFGTNRPTDVPKLLYVSLWKWRT